MVPVTTSHFLLDHSVQNGKMTSHYAAGPLCKMRGESESGIRKWEEMWFNRTAEDGKRGGGCRDVRWKTGHCSTDERLQQETLCRCVDPGKPIACSGHTCLQPDRNDSTGQTSNKRTLRPCTCGASLNYVRLVMIGISMSAIGQTDVKNAAVCHKYACQTRRAPAEKRAPSGLEGHCWEGGCLDRRRGLVAWRPGR